MATSNVKREKKLWEERFSQHFKRKKETRDPFEIDMARLIHSAAFRRLQGKTQILGLGDSDFYRTRLTHSIEVAQIATGILRSLKKSDSAKCSKHLPSSSLITTVSLAHDIGHPPFGHGGEIALNFMMRNHGGFEGNAQTLRLIHLLEPRTMSGGINLTRRTLLGLIKYPAKYSDVNNPANNIEKKDTTNFSNIKLENWKPPKCYYDEEQSLVNWILEPFGQSDRAKFTHLETRSLDSYAHQKTVYRSLDTSIMEIADDIAYGVHDLEDSIAMGLISKEEWEEGSKECIKNIDLEWLRKRLLTKPERKTITGAPQDIFNNKLFGSSWERKDAVGTLVHMLVTSVKCSKNPEFTSPLLQFNAEINGPASELLKCLKNVVSERVIKSANVQTLEYRGLRMVSELFHAFRTNPTRLLPEKTLERIKIQGATLERGIADYISGMTDEYATQIYERLFVPREGSIHQFR